MRALVRGVSLWAACLLCSAPALAGSIDTSALERPWPKQRTHEYEVRRYAVQWRERTSPSEGIFAGAEFVAPAAREAVWNISADYADLGRRTPGVESVKVIEQSPTRQVIQTDIKVLWKTLRLTFEIEREPPEVIRFRLVNDVIGEYRGVCRLMPEGQGTAMLMATWLQPAVRISPSLVLLAERIVMLHGIREFLGSCEEAGGLDNAPAPAILPR